MTNIYKNREIPKFLLDKRYLFGSVVFILTFSILFMAIYAPFSNTAWFGVRSVMELNMTITFYIVALAIMFISKMLMNTYQKHIRFTYAKYIAWIVVEILVISIFYTHFTLLYMPMQEVDEITILMKALGCIILIMAIPYTMLTLYAAYRDKTEELQMLQYEMSMGEGAVSYPSLVNLYDYNGTLKLTINSDSLYYMESQDNYVKIYYENQGKLLSYMLRCRTKAIEENLAETSMVRCHRSYIVNIEKIRFLQEERRLHFIALDDESIKRIPVSRSYYDSVVASFDKLRRHRG
jgi:DNA-binding LytR/AlgR family response regulator